MCGQWLRLFRLGTGLFRCPARSLRPTAWSALQALQSYLSAGQRRSSESNARPVRQVGVALLRPPHHDGPGRGHRLLPRGPRPPRSDPRIPPLPRASPRCHGPACRRPRCASAKTRSALSADGRCLAVPGWSAHVFANQCLGRV